MKFPINLPIAVTATDRASMDCLLDEAVTLARKRATPQARHGILVTRHAHDSFTVALSDSVPFGLTREYQEW